MPREQHTSFWLGSQHSLLHKLLSKLQDNSSAISIMNGTNTAMRWNIERMRLDFMATCEIAAEHDEEKAAELTQKQVRSVTCWCWFTSALLL